VSFGSGLSGASTEELKELLRALHRGRLAFPLERTTLLVMGLNGLADHGDLLVGLDERGVRSVIVAVLAERSAAERALESGPPRG
jgi:hypothetical protein